MKIFLLIVLVTFGSNVIAQSKGPAKPDVIDICEYRNCDDEK